MAPKRIHDTRDQEFSANWCVLHLNRLIGFAMIVFYSLLLSISERLPFGRAYLISAAAVTALITG